MLEEFINSSVIQDNITEISAMIILGALGLGLLIGKWITND